MGMAMSGEVTLPADRATVWAKLNDPEVLKNCIGVIESMERTGDNTFAATVRIKLGPVQVAFRGVIALSDVDPLVGYRINAEGQGGIAGVAKGVADVWLSDVPEGTLLRYDVQADLGGRLARMGASMVDGVAIRAADRFFAGFAAQLAR